MSNSIVSDSLELRKNKLANLKKDFIRITFQLKTKFFKNLSQVFFKRNQRNFKKIKFVL